MRLIPSFIVDKTVCIRFRTLPTFPSFAAGNPTIHLVFSHWRLTIACVIAENTTWCPLDHEHKKRTQTAEKNERTSRSIHRMRRGCLSQKEREGGREIKGGKKTLATLPAHWPPPMLSGTWAMACELRFPRDQSAKRSHVI